MPHAAHPDEKTDTVKPTRRATQRWAYPFALCDTKAPDAMHSHFKALSGMTYGFFPLSNNGFPNGSVHFGNDVKEDWKAESERQNRRGWWPDVAGKIDSFPKDPREKSTMKLRSFLTRLMNQRLQALR